MNPKKPYINSEKTLKKTCENVYSGIPLGRSARAAGIDTRRVQVQTFRGFAKPTGLCVANDQLLVSDRGANEAASGAELPTKTMGYGC